MAHILDRLGGSCGEELLTLRHQSFQALNVLSLRLVVEDVSDVLGENFLTTCTSVDTDHSHTDGLE